MKKFIVMTIFGLMSISCFGQSLLFMGVDVDQSYISFNRSISPKLTFDGEGSSHVAYTGSFAGLSNCHIYVNKSSRNTVSSVSVTCWALDPDVISRMIASYSEKYGPIYKTYQKSSNNEVVATYFDYMVGLHMIEIVVDFCSNNSCRMIIKYIPRGFANENSNLRVNKSDI